MDLYGTPTVFEFQTNLFWSKFKVHYWNLMISWMTFNKWISTTMIRLGIKSTVSLSTQRPLGNYFINYIFFNVEDKQIFEINSREKMSQTEGFSLFLKRHVSFSEIHYSVTVLIVFLLNTNEKIVGGSYCDICSISPFHLLLILRTNFVIIKLQKWSFF